MAFARSASSQLRSNFPPRLFIKLSADYLSCALIYASSIYYLCADIGVLAAEAFPHPLASAGGLLGFPSSASSFSVSARRSAAVSSCTSIRMRRWWEGHPLHAVAPSTVARSQAASPHCLTDSETRREREDSVLMPDRRRGTGSRPLLHGEVEAAAARRTSRPLVLRLWRLSCDEERDCFGKVLYVTGKDARDWSKDARSPQECLQ